MAGAVSLLAGMPAGEWSADPGADLRILNVALGLEHEGINADQRGAMSGLLQKPVLDIAVAFRSDHRPQRALLF